MTEILYSGQIETYKLPQLLAACQPEQATEDVYLLVEQLPAHVVRAGERQNMLRFERYCPDTDVSAYTSGRVFQYECELRWEQWGELCQIVYLGSERNERTLSAYKLSEYEDFRRLLTEEKLERSEKRYYLFGERTQQDGPRASGVAEQGKVFAEPRIPRPFYYPVQGSPRYVQLMVREYIHRETGQIECFRFQALLPAAETALTARDGRYAGTN